METNFVDYVKICCRSGKGGDGVVHFHRDKFTTKGGPDGGDGGRGGHIILRGNKQLWTLLHLKYRKHVIAEDGENGGKSNMTGKSGKDEILEVPLGTIARNAETGKIECEITENGQEFILVRGGKGGLGNAHFATPSRQAPQFAQEGEPGKTEWKILELKVLADVGLVGFPNAGKSTLLSVLTAAKPEIANYPFTTLVPQLGIVSYRDFKSFVMADLPGLIEGAHEGKGLGYRFLRHVERNSVLLFVISVENANIFEEYKILLKELELYNPDLLNKKRALAISKADLLDDELMQEISKELNKKLKGKNKLPYIFISSHTGFNLQALKDILWKTLNE